MRRLAASYSAVLIVFLLGAGQRPASGPSGLGARAEELRRLKAEYHSEAKKLSEAVQKGIVKKDERGEVPELGHLRSRFAPRVRKLIDAGPTDEVALDAILFSMHELVADASDPKLFDILLAHHIESPKLAEIVTRPPASEEFLRTLAAKSPHAQVRQQASLTLAGRLLNEGRSDDAERLLEPLEHQPGGTGKAAERLLFEIRHLSTGKEAPEIEGFDLDRDEHGKLQPMKLSEFRGKVVYLVFWATWCGPCMAMVPHESELVKKYSGRPFAVVGVNGEGEPDAQVRAIIRRAGVNWRSFQSAPGVGIVDRWNVTMWPTVYVLDEQGIIREKFHGLLDGAGQKAG